MDGHPVCPLGFATLAAFACVQTPTTTMSRGRSTVGSSWPRPALPPFPNIRRLLPGQPGRPRGVGVTIPPLRKATCTRPGAATGRSALGAEVSNPPHRALLHGVVAR
eukprot:1526224-Lingulodinium_polyedra.AAC.1